METDALRTLWTECFGNEENWIDAFFSTAFDPNHVCCLNRQGSLAAGLCWMDTYCQGRPLAYLYAIATDPEHRHQGLCRELMGKAHDHLARQGYAGTVLVPGDEGLRQMYGKMNYVNFGGIRRFCAEAGEPIPIRRLSSEEYTALRREYLPAGGVIQENGAMEFLASWAGLYGGGDFLLAMTADGVGQELLGNADAAPGILGALGLERGSFRVPGEEPFAMFRSLSEDDWQPGYFGLAFE